MVRRSGAKLAVRFALIAAGVAVALVFAELFLRMLPSGMVAAPDLYRKEEGLLLLRPGLARRHVTPFWDVTIAINQDGLRDVDRPPASGETILLGLGDSMAFGWGVELEETYLARLEAGERVRLVKAGVPGTGTSDQVRMLERLTPVVRPDAVMLSFFVGNDFVDVAHGGSAQFEVVDGFLVRTDSDEPLRGLAIRSRLLQLLRAAQFRLGAGAFPQRHWDEWMREYAELHLATPPERAQRAVRETLTALDELDSMCSDAGIPLLLVVLPRSYQVSEDERQEMLRSLGWRPEDLEMDRPQRVLATWADRRRAEMVDVLPAFRAHAANGGGPQFFTPDAHMTAEGHRVAAEAIRPALDALLQQVH